MHQLHRGVLLLRILVFLHSVLARILRVDRGLLDVLRLSRRILQLQLRRDFLLNVRHRHLLEQRRERVHLMLGRVLLEHHGIHPLHLVLRRLLLLHWVHLLHDLLSRYRISGRSFRVHHLLERKVLRHGRIAHLHHVFGRILLERCIF